MTRSLALALALATPAAAEPLLPVATDDAVIATSDATDHSFRMPPAWTAPVDHNAERNLRDKLRSLSLTRPDLSRDRWLMCGAFAFDAATTVWSVESGNHEAAPVTRAVIGKRPSPLAVAGFMAAKCGAFLALGTVLERTDTRGARLFYRINIGVATVAGVNNVGVALKVRF